MIQRCHSFSCGQHGAPDEDFDPAKHCRDCYAAARVPALAASLGRAVLFTPDVIAQAERGRKPRGPGTELKKLLASFGITDATGCSCQSRAAEMDRQGVGWCRANRATIAGWLKEEAGRRSWATKVKAAAKALASGFVPNPLDVYGSLVDEAIRRATPPPDPFAPRITTDERAKLYELLGRADRALTALGVRYCLWAGALLGHVRQGRMLDYDDDVDLMVIDPLPVDALRAALPDLGVLWDGRVARVFDPRDPVPAGSAHAQPFPFLDLDNSARVEGDALHLPDPANFPARKFRAADVLPTTRGRLGPVEVSLPADPKALVAANYGAACLSSQLPPSWDHKRHKPTGLPQARAPLPTPTAFEWVSTPQLARDAIALAGKLPPDVTAVAGVPRSGILPAGVVATHLHLPLFQLTEDGQLTRLGTGDRGRTLGFPADAGRIAVIDDTVYGGTAMRKVRGRVKRPAVFAAVYVRPESAGAVDVFARPLPSPHLLEWNFANNGPFAGFAANPCYRGGVGMDLDGVIVHDAESAAATGAGVLSPYLVPRTHPCKLIATGRPERHRAETEALLRTVGARWVRLEMLPGHVEPTPENAARHKARHYAASGLGFFVESDPAQAALIHYYTGLPVVCPIAGRVFQ